jgi:hypothetical protein
MRNDEWKAESRSQESGVRRKEKLKAVSALSILGSEF